MYECGSEGGKFKESGEEMYAKRKEMRGRMKGISPLVILLVI